MTKVSIQTFAAQELIGILNAPDPDNPDTVRNKPGARETLVVMIHDFPGHKGWNNELYSDLEFILAKSGNHTLRFDFRGCGESDGKEEHFMMAGAAEDFQHVLHWAKEQGYKNFVYVGAGLGATLSIMNVALDVRGMILLWPVLDPKMIYKNYFSKVCEQHDGEPFQWLQNHRVGNDFLKEIKEQDIIYAMKEVHMPTLIMQGTNDNILPAAHLDLARGFIPAKRIEITTFHEGQYGLPNLTHRKAMFHHIKQFVERYA